MNDRGLAAASDLGNGMTPERYDVVIIGYGPTGLTAASLLARRGHSVCVFERWPSLYGQPRMATIDGESARIIQAACDVDVALRNSVERTQYVLANEAGQVLVDHAWGGIHVCGFPNRISLHQPDMEDSIDARARQYGADVNQGWEFQSLEQSEDLVRVTVRERTADEVGDVTLQGKRMVAARYLIGADGARSAVRAALGIEREEWPFRSAWWSIDAKRKRLLPDFWGLSPDGRVAVNFCAPEGRAHSVIPLGVNVVRFNFEVDPDADHRWRFNSDQAYRQLRSVYGVGEEDVEVYRQAIYPFEGKLAKTWRIGRVFLAGDAAHVMTPFLGQGGCSGLRDAINLAWKFDLVLTGKSKPALLDTYERERLPHARHYVGGSDKLAAMAFTADPKAAAERDQLYISGRAPPAPPEPVLGEGVLHRNVRGEIEAPVGHVSPQGIVQLGSKTGRMDDLFDWGFQLIAWGDEPLRHVTDSQHAFLGRIGCAVVGLAKGHAGNLAIDVTGAYRRFLDQYGAIAILARPDFVIFGIARTPSEVPTMVDDLQRQLA
jgi:3-(3-hydroxy-phenyl)propionate hydroxylase